MPFSIDIESAQELQRLDPGDSTTSEAIESIYGHGSAIRINFGENAVARLPMAGGVSDIYNDIIRMLNRLDLDIYPFQISFLCSCFTAIWSFSAPTELLTIKMRWTAIDGMFQDREFRNERFNDVAGQLVVDKKVFISSWHSLLLQIKRDLLSAGYTRQLENFEYLNSLG
jgi:hypothetical protein